MHAVAKKNDSTSSDMSQLLDDSSTSQLENEADKIVDGMDFGDLCNEFECKSSPLVESTARQLLRDILELRQGNRALGVYAVSVNYKVRNVAPALLYFCLPPILYMEKKTEQHSSQGC